LLAGTQEPAGWQPVPGYGGATTFRAGTMAVTGKLVTGAGGGVLVLATGFYDGKIYIGQWNADGSWGDWALVPGAPSGALSVSLAWMSGGAIQFVANTSAGLYHTLLPAGGKWTDVNWAIVPGAGTPAYPAWQLPVSIAATPSGDAQLVGVSGNSVVHSIRSFANGSWQDWRVIGAPQSVPQLAACIACFLPDGTTRVLARAQGPVQLVSSDVRQFCGVWNLPDLPHKFPQGDAGCVYLNGDGEIVTGYLTPDLQPQSGVGSPRFTHFPTSGLEFDSAISWQDADGTLHVYANAGGDLRILHQTGWQRFTLGDWDRLMPAWTQAEAVKSAPDGEITPLNVTTTVAVGLQSGVVNFWLDAYPDYKPSELVQGSGVAEEEAFSFLTQDFTSTTWVNDTVRLPSGLAPHIVSRYVADATLLDTNDAPMPGRTITVSAPELTEVHLDGVSYLVGPGKNATATTNSMGKVTVSVRADSLAAPSVILGTDGLAGVTIDFGASVNNYLAGTGTLPSQQGTFTAATLQNATCTDADGNKTPLVSDWGNAPVTAEQTVSHCQAVYAMAAGNGTTQLTAMIDGFAEPQPIVGYVIQKWDPSRPSYQVFRTQEELDAYRAYRNSHPAYGGFWDDFVNWAGDVWEGIKTAATKVAEVIVETVVEIAIWIGEAIVSLGEMIINAVEQAIRAVEAVFQMIVDAINRLIDWLKALFSFHDIWQTKKAIESGMKTLIGLGVSTIEKFANVSSGFFQQKEADVIALFTELKAQYGGNSVGDFQNKAPQLQDSTGNQVDKTAVTDNPQANWMLNQTHGAVTRQLSAGRELAFSAPGQSATDLIAAIVAAFTGIGTDLDNSGAISDLMTAGADLGQAIASLFDPSAGPSGSMVALLDLLEHLALAALKALDAIVQAMGSLAGTVRNGLYPADGSPGIMDTPLGVPFLDTLYGWFQDVAGVPANEREANLTFGSCGTLVLAFFSTIIYKLINGVDNPPFPDGTFPQLDMPTWHPDFDADAQATMSAQTAINLQIYSNVFGVLGTGMEGIADLIAYGQAAGASPTLPWIQAFFAMFYTFADVFTWMLGNVPEVTGSGWDDAAWAGAFASGSAITVCEFAAIFYYRSISAVDQATSSAFLRYAKINRVLMGPVVSGLLGGTALFCEAASCAVSGTNPYLTAQYVTGMIPETIQVFRKLAPNSLLLAGGIGIADLLLNGASTIMGLVASFWEGQNKPVITTTSLPAAVPGLDYTKGGTVATGLAATGGDKPWNSPIRNWGPAPGTSLPPGLNLDPSTGVITGAVQGTATSYTFQVQCSDSYNVSQYSAPQKITLTVAPVEAANIAPGTTDKQPVSMNVFVGTTNNPYNPNPDITVKATDSSGAPVQYAQVRFSLPADSATFLPQDGSGPLNGSSDAYVYTDNQGLATAPAFTTSGVVGKYVMQAGIQGQTTTDASGQPVINYLVGPVTAAVITNLETNVTSLDPAPTSTGQHTWAGTVSTAVSPPRSVPGGVFPNQLIAIAKVGSALAENVVIVFSAPADDPKYGSYGVFQRNGSSTRVAVTNAKGEANAGLFSGENVNTDSSRQRPDFPVDFTITAQISGVSTPQAAFTMEYDSAGQNGSATQTRAQWRTDRAS
jgi:hypothetical protein